MITRIAPPCHIVGGIDQPGLAPHRISQQCHVIYTKKDGFRAPVIYRDHIANLAAAGEAFMDQPSAQTQSRVQRIARNRPVGVRRWQQAMYKIDRAMYERN